MVTSSSEKPRILWADDNADMRSYVQRLLSDRYEVETVPDGEMALGAARARPPDLVLSDVIMRRLGGFELLNALRANSKTRAIPVILLSARADEESRVEGLEAGADDYLIKPFSGRELLARIGAHVQLKRLHEEAGRYNQALLAEARAAEQRLDAVLQSISDGFLALDHEWRYTAVNDRACESMGMKREEILGRTIWDLFPDTIDTPFEAELRRAAAQQESTIFEYLYPARNLWFENRVYPAADGISIFFADITARKQAEEHLRQSEAMLAEAQQVAHIGSWNWDLRTNLIAWSDEHYRILGLQPQDAPVVADWALGFIHPDDRAMVVDLLKHTVAAHEAYELSLRIVRADGVVRDVQSRGSAEYDEHGQPTRLFGTIQDVTDRVQAEDALRESEARFRGTFENAAVGIAHMDRACHYIRVNGRFSEILGYSPDDLCAVTCLGITHPEDMTLGVDQFDALMHGDMQSFSLQKRYVRKDGTHVWVNMSVSLQRDTAGSPAYAIEVIEDISDRKRAEESLRVANERLDLAMRGSNIGIWEVDMPDGVLLHGKFTSVNLWEQLGHGIADSPKDLAHGMAAVHPDDQERTRRAVEDCLSEKGRQCEVENRLLHRNGTYRWMLTRGIVIRDDNGRPVRFVGTIQDITERKRAEEALRASEARMTSDLTAMTRLQEVSIRLVRDGDVAPLLLEIVDAAIAITGANIGTVQLYNPAEDTLEVVASRGLDAGALASFGTVRPGQCTCGTALQRRERVVVADVTTSPIFAGKPELKAILAAGIRAAQSTPLVDRAGRIVGMLSTHYRQPTLPAEADLRVVDLLARQAADWIERTRAEETIKRAKDAAEQANRIKDEFVAIVSHELRTPLAAILLWSQILEERKMEAEIDVQAVRAIQESARVQQQLIEDLLDVSRMLAGEIRLNRQEIELTPIIHAALDIVRPIAAAKRVEIEVTSDPQPALLRGDPSRIQQIVVNLLNNAVKFTPGGGRINVRLARIGAKLQIQVTDTGEGISPDFLPHLFERFRQADSSNSRRHGGLGLGLAIARQLVELHGGTISADSAGEGRGATFTVELPALPPRNDSPAFGASPPAAGAAQPFTPSPILRGKRILVVEDDAANRQVIEYLLARCEAEVTGVESAAAALRAFQAAIHNRRFDLLLSDIGLPEMNGHELIRRIREIERHGGNIAPTPAVALTAYAGDKDRDAAIAAGFTAHQPKPFDAASLVSLVASLVR